MRVSFAKASTLEDLSALHAKKNPRNGGLNQTMNRIVHEITKETYARMENHGYKIVVAPSDGEQLLEIVVEGTWAYKAEVGVTEEVPEVTTNGEISTADRIKELLSSGPMKTRELAERLKLHQSTILYSMQKSSHRGEFRKNKDKAWELK
jgi:hypothetical protein